MENGDRPEPETDVQPVYLEDEVKKSFLDYAMSVIVSRALPDVRDGLKPVQRRILYSMQELGLLHNRPYKKSATVVGDVLGKYHPHGDMAVYDTMVRMAQDFSLRYTLVDGQGNFGSVDGDAAAAYRYTETRLDSLAEELLHDLDKDTVRFMPNFDGRLKEPTVLPASFPNLLVNGSYGIAVGMATSIPPHNFGEVIDGIIALIKDPALPVEKLIGYIKGPDFPTGGLIIGREGIFQAYTTGRGKAIVRGKVRFEEGKLGKDKIIITEIPYQVNKTSLLETIARLVREKKIEDVTDLRDESDRDGMRVVLELKRDANQELVMNQLYKFTPLQSTQSIILLVLVDNVPKILNLKQICEQFIEFRYQTVYKRTQFELKQAEDRAHILEGLIIALDNIDKVIALIRASKDTPSAKLGLMAKFRLSERQAEAILEMKLARLTGLERHKIEEELAALKQEIGRLKALLASRKAIMDLIQDELLALRKKYSDERRTDLIEGRVEDIELEDLIAEEDVTVIITHRGYIKRMPVSIYRRQARGGVGRSGLDMTETDYVEGIFTASTHDYMMFFTNQGRCYWLKVYEIPEGSHQSKGRPVVNLIQLEPDEKVAARLAVREFPADKNVFMVTRLGTVKKTPLDAFANVRNKGIIAITLDKGDALINTFITSGKDEVVVVTKKGQGLKFSEKDVRSMGRGASGVRGIRVGKNDEVIDGVVAQLDASLLIISEQGFGKRTDFKLFPIRHRGGKGVIAAKIMDKSGDLVKIHSTKDGEEIIVITRDGTVMRVKADEIRKQGRSSTGVKIISVREGDAVADIAPAE